MILSSQASARSTIVGNTVSALTAQKAFLNNFEDIINRRVDIREDTNRYQETLSYASSKVDCSVGENIYMFPSNMSLNIRPGTVRYNNKILISDGKFRLGKMIRLMLYFTLLFYLTFLLSTQPTITHKVVTQTTVAHTQKPTNTHEEEKIALILSLLGTFTTWYMFG